MNVPFTNQSQISLITAIQYINYYIMDSRKLCTYVSKLNFANLTQHMINMLSY